ncbi:DNA phosphorothioation-dependent restriction protein DptG [Alteromonas sp. BMJM2]|uniref:DNA phosphorothioation-dependent restriction protein DptG n=1 Tax=Alteromonas sp. BMJM2 TaxID=2954241 RepID=UPI0022B3C6F5|nr:DNA phosphorothioation-dependent restriction protein DptG [Alteromonas sp. BMJM2]
MYKLKAELKPKDNKASFFPINTKDRKDVFDWDVILGHFVKHAYRKNIANNQFEQFKLKCKENFESKLDEPQFWQHLERMYFEGDELFNISPELLLFKAQDIKGNSANKRLGDLFLNLLQGHYLQKSPSLNLNFLEKALVETFNSCVVTGSTVGTVSNSPSELPYLPFLRDLFIQDLDFIASKPRYFIENITAFLKLYAFIYTTQLTLNLSEWRAGEPTAKSCYFILDTEKASNERTYIKNFGYRLLANNFSKVFPYLAMNDSLQDSKAVKVPLWDIHRLIEGEEALTALNKYALDFKADRKLDIPISPASNIISALENLLELFQSQFNRGESRHDINIYFAKAIESELCGHFIQSRGRAGRVLVFNQDYLLLLTNIVIGKRERLRLHELLMEFSARGICFDKQTQKVLVDFYERIGNVERMSDSGDAVYVRKTV